MQSSFREEPGKAKKSMKIRELGEIGLIERISKGIKLDRSVVKGIGDDAAVVAWGRDKYMLYTCDMLVEDTHFTLRAATPFRIGWKAMARNISDIAAMGGLPRYAVVSLGINPGRPVSFVDGLYKGMKAAANIFKVNIVGGDIARSKNTIINISLTGEVEKKNLVTRDGAKIGDFIFVTGTIGGSIKGKHLRFTPRVRQARMLVENFTVNSMIDVSDGLFLDLGRILTASRVGARIERKSIPISKDAESLEKAITDGEDFELLFTMGAREAKRFLKSKFTQIDSGVTLIGEVTDKRHGYTLAAEDGKERKITKKGYLHF